MSQHNKLSTKHSAKQERNPISNEEFSETSEGPGKLPEGNSSRPRNRAPGSSRDTGDTKESSKAPEKSYSGQRTEEPTSSDHISSSSNAHGKASVRDPPTTSSKTSVGEGKQRMHISFIARVQELKALFETQGPRYTKQKFWDPPTTKEEVQASNTLFFRWEDGIMEKIPPPRPVDPTQPLVQRTVCSVFVQKGTGHLLFSNVNAAGKDVKNSKRGGWKRLFFNWEPVSSKSKTFYTDVQFGGEKDLTAAPMSGHCVPQLIPEKYDNPSSKKKNGGVIGDLSLLIALAVFSAPHQHLVSVLTTCLRPGKWRQHKLPSGLVEWRGAIVCILYDPDNPKGSTKEYLDALGEGQLGSPFYD